MTTVISVDNLSVKQQNVLKALREGNTRTAAADRSSVHRSTFYRWLQRDSRFAEAVIEAEAEAEAEFVRIILGSARGGHVLRRSEVVKPDGSSSTVEQYARPDWRAAESWLKRRRRKEWGDHVAIGADAEAAEVLAQLFPGDAGAGSGETAVREGCTDARPDEVSD